jgi:DNA-binding response OmpR family regulator
LPVPERRQLTKKALAADDFDSMRALLRHMLELAGFDCVLAKDGDLEVHFAGSPFDLVILDVEMPGLTGLEVLRLIRARDAAVAVLVISGNPHYKQDALLAGATAFFEKSATNDGLRAFLRSFQPRRDSSA